MCLYFGKANLPNQLTLRLRPQRKGVDVIVVFAIVLPKLFGVHPMEAAGVEITADETVPPAAGRTSGAALAAGLANPEVEAARAAIPRGSPAATAISVRPQ